MKAGRIILGVGLALVAAALVIRGQDQTVPTKLIIFEGAQRLHDKCNHVDEDSFPPGSTQRDDLAIQQNNGFCTGYIVGIAESYDVKWWSPPETLNTRQLVAVVKKYIDLSGFQTP
jgi:hypothetical protein